MGLDMYANKTKHQPDTEVDFKVPEEVETHEVWYWRKHPNLHGWMEKLYNDKGGQEEFNCVNVQLKAEDLDALERDLNASRLPSTSGFFFGQSSGDLEEIKEDLEFIAEAREAIAEGYTVFYSSWW